MIMYDLDFGVTYIYIKRINYKASNLNLLTSTLYEMIETLKKEKS